MGPFPTLIWIVIVVLVVLALLGWGLLELLERRYGTRRGDDIWVAVAVVAMLLSLLGPVIAGLTISATVGLLAIHIVAAGILIAFLPTPPGRHGELPI